MPPKKTAAAEVADEDGAQKGADAEMQRKVPAHPATSVMVKEALTELDSRKGVSSVAVQGFIKQKYPTVDAVRLKHLVRKALKKGLESGAVVRPANSTVTTGVVGKFRLATKVKAPKPKSENVDPNVPKVAKKAKDEVKKGAAKDSEKAQKKEAKEPKKDGGKKKSEKGSKKDKGEDAEEETKETKETKEPKAPKKPKEKQAAKVAPAKKPKAKAAKTEENSATVKRKAAATRAAGKRGKTAED